MMDFALAERQQAVADLAAQVLAGVEGSEGADPWKELAQAGLLDVSPPDGLGVLDAAVLLTEIGRRAPSRQALATLMTGALPVARWGSRDQQRALLPGVASGELLLTAALREPSHPAPTPPATAVTNGKITGTKVGVPHAAEAHRILVPTRQTPAPAAASLDSMIMSSSGQIVSKTAHDHGVALVPARGGGGQADPDA